MLRVTIWDQDDDPPSDVSEILLWRAYAREERASVPQYLEKHAERLREKYLAFVHDLGEHVIAGRRVVEHLDIGDEFSLWWMTLLAERSPLKSPRIYDCLRLIALEELLAARRPEAVTVVTRDRVLARCVRELCAGLEASFRWETGGALERGSPLRRIYDILPRALQGLLSLRHLVSRWPLRELRSPQWFDGDDAVLVCSYFIHLDGDSCAAGHFHSRQWESLPRSLHAGGKRTNWIQLFLQSAVVPDASTGARWVRGFNSRPEDNGCHAFLESYLSSRVVLAALRRWCWLNVVRWRLRAIRPAFELRGSRVSLWPLLRDDWSSSLTGTVAMANCLWLELFDAALADVPMQRTGLYLYENQAWEKAFLRAWRRHGHGHVIGVQHATTPFWYLPYVEQTMAASKPCCPLPDRIAANGDPAVRVFGLRREVSERVDRVEALRYLGLAGLAATRRADTNRRRAGPVRVLILGEIIPTSMHHLLRLLDRAAGSLRGAYVFTLKAHPSYAPDLSAYPALHPEQTGDSLAKILVDHDIAIAANSTSAAVDAFVAGLPVIIGLGGGELNLSPLRGQRNVRFVSSCEEMVAALQTIACGADEADARDRDGFFHLDVDLPRWKQLLAYSDQRSGARGARNVR